MEEIKTCLLLENNMSGKRESDESESLFLRTDYTFTSLSEMNKWRLLQRNLSSDFKLACAQSVHVCHIFHAD